MGLVQNPKETLHSAPENTTQRKYCSFKNTAKPGLVIKYKNSYVIFTPLAEFSSPLAEGKVTEWRLLFR